MGSNTTNCSTLDVASEIRIEFEEHAGGAGEGEDTPSKPRRRAIPTAPGRE